jgi:hypothetical protein
MEADVALEKDEVESAWPAGTGRVAKFSDRPKMPGGQFSRKVEEFGGPQNEKPASRACLEAGLPIRGNPALAVHAIGSSDSSPVFSRDRLLRPNPLAS